MRIQREISLAWRNVIFTRKYIADKGVVNFSRIFSVKRFDRERCQLTLAANTIVYRNNAQFRSRSRNSEFLNDFSVYNVTIRARVYHTVDDAKFAASRVDYFDGNDGANHVILGADDAVCGSRG